MIADADVRLDQLQLQGDLGVVLQIVQQPNQRQLCIWIRIDPELDRLAPRAELDQSDVFSSQCFEMLRADKLQPMGTQRAAFGRARPQERCELRIGRLRSPDKPSAERK